MKRFLIRTLKISLPLVVIGIAGFAAITMVRNRPPVETQPPVFSPPGVQVHQVALSEVAMGVTSQGTVQPRTESQLVPEISGRVTWVSSSFAEGGFFEEGDALVKIDPFDYEQALISARSQLAQARLRLAQEQAEAEIAEREWNDLGRGDPRELTLRKPQLDEAQESQDVEHREGSEENPGKDEKNPFATRVDGRCFDGMQCHGLNIARPAVRKRGAAAVALRMDFSRRLRAR